MNGIITAVYAAMLSGAGIYAYVSKGSMMSLIFSLAFALWVAVVAFMFFTKHQRAERSAIEAFFALFLVFGYRFLVTHGIFPGLVFALISGALLGYFSWRLYRANNKKKYS